MLDNRNVEAKISLSSKQCPYGETNIGMKRSNNEDMVLIFNPDGLGKKNLHGVFAVADGVGGRNHGEVAAEKIVKELYGYANAGKYITWNQLKNIDKKISQGASTLVLAQQLKNKNKFLIDSVGDSSAFLIDTVNNTIIELTQRDEDPYGRVTQVMGPEGRYSAPFTRTNRTIVELKQGQTLMLASDGLTKYMDKKRIKPANILQLSKNYEKDNQRFVRELIKMANIQGGDDNVSIVSVPFNSELN